MYNPFLISALKKCKTGQAVDAAFEKCKTNDLGKRIGYLYHCMGNPQGVFFGGKEKENCTEELYSKYITMRSMFITGSWR